MSAVKILAEELESTDIDPLEQALHAWEIRRSDPKESHRIALYLIDHALEIDDPLVTGWAYLTCGVHELAQSTFNVAGDSFHSAITLFVRVGERRGESLAQVALARLHMTKGEFQPALELFKAIIEREAHGLLPLEKFEAFNGIGGCFWGLDKMELCLLYLSKAYDVLKHTNFIVERATVLSNIGTALIKVGNHDTAREFLMAALNFADQTEDRVLKFNLQSSLIACLIDLKETATALPVAVRLLRDFQDMLFAGPYNIALCNIAVAFAYAEEWKLAEHCLRSAQKIADETDVDLSSISVNLAHAQVAEVRGDFAVAIARAEYLLEEQATSLDADAKAQAYSLLVNCYHKVGQHEGAVRFKKRKLELADLRYQSGLAAAMVVLDLKSSLRLQASPAA